jgi:hypothetical protein
MGQSKLDLLQGTVCFPFAARGSTENSVVGPGRISTVLQAIRGRSVQATAGGKKGYARLRASELAMVLDGIDVSKLKRVPRYARISGENKEKILV